MVCVPARIPPSVALCVPPDIIAAFRETPLFVIAWIPPLVTVVSRAMPPVTVWLPYAEKIAPTTVPPSKTS